MWIGALHELSPALYYVAWLLLGVGVGMVSHQIHSLNKHYRWTERIALRWRSYCETQIALKTRSRLDKLRSTLEDPAQFEDEYDQLMPAYIPNKPDATPLHPDRRTCHTWSIREGKIYDSQTETIYPDGTRRMIVWMEVCEGGVYYSGYYTRTIKPTGDRLEISYTQLKNHSQDVRQLIEKNESQLQAVEGALDLADGNKKGSPHEGSLSCAESEDSDPADT